MIDVRQYEARDAAWIVEQHQTLYAQDEGFDDSFGPLVANILDQFEADHDPARDRGWVADGPSGLLGSIFCVRQAAGIAKLRLFLVHPEARGQGLGVRLLDTCVGFARETGYDQIRLWTHAEHRAACALYARCGWRCVSSEPVHSFGRDLTAQTWTLDL